MEFNQETVQRLTQLRETPKFTDDDWDKRGLILSDSEKVNEMKVLMDSCLDELIVDVKSNSTDRQVKKTLTKGLKRFKTSNYDTEEKEFIADEFHKIGSILGLDISDTLNSWLYGSVLGTIINLTKRKEVVLDSRSIECTKCNLTLTLKITSRREDTPNYWIIGQCVQCGEHNLLSTGENTDELKFENFTSTEVLDSNENTEEQAKTRLEQLKYFRRKS